MVPNVIKPSRLVAVQLQPVGAEMLINAAPPLAAMDELTGVIEVTQDVPAWTTVST
jgi:hypothetical protein